MKKVVAVVITAVVFLVIVGGAFVVGAFGTMLLVGALHSAVPVVPAISFVGACWLVGLLMWFRLMLSTASANTSK